MSRRVLRHGAAKFSWPATTAFYFRTCVIGQGSLSSIRVNFGAFWRGFVPDAPLLLDAAIPGPPEQQQKKGLCHDRV